MDNSQYFQIQERIQNKVKKYYLLREVNSDSRKFRATKLIKSRTPPTKDEVARAILLHGFDLEMKVCSKVASFRTKNFKYAFPGDDDAYFELERYRYLDMRYHELASAAELSKHLKHRDLHFIHQTAKSDNCTFTFHEVEQMLVHGKVPSGKYLRDINEIQNRAELVAMRNEDLKKVTLSLIQKIHRIHCHGIEKPEELTPLMKDNLQNLIDGFYQKLKEGYHPYEQTMIWYCKFCHLKPYKFGTIHVAREISLYMILPEDCPVSFQSTESVMIDKMALEKPEPAKWLPIIVKTYVGNHVKEMETEVKKKIAEKFDPEN